jgi:hypothetical protein
LEGADFVEFSSSVGECVFFLGGLDECFVDLSGFAGFGDGGGGGVDVLACLGEGGGVEDDADTGADEIGQAARSRCSPVPATKSDSAQAVCAGSTPPAAATSKFPPIAPS